MMHSKDAYKPLIVRIGHALSCIALNNSYVICGDNTGNIYAIDAVTGLLAFKQKMAEYGIISIHSFQNHLFIQPKIKHISIWDFAKDKYILLYDILDLSLIHI